MKGAVFYIPECIEENSWPSPGIPLDASATEITEIERQIRNQKHSNYKNRR